jgi:hypothetical protein
MMMMNFVRLELNKNKYIKLEILKNGNRKNLQ